MGIKKLNKLTVTETRDRLSKKEISSLDLVSACLNQIKKKDPKIKAFITVCQDEARSRAKEVDQLIASGKADFKSQPLLGIPFSLKDVYMTKGIKTTAGSKILKDHIAAYDATIYKKLTQSGAILIGKTNCDAWGHGSSTENSDFFVTKNPWNTDYVAGGSSGGSAAAVASDFSLFEVGEDTGGSIRLPASFCSIVGLKVTYGLVSRYGSIAYASSLDTVGPMTKTVADCALVLESLVGLDPLDATSSDKGKKEYSKLINQPIKNLSLGLPKEFFKNGLDPEVKEKINKSIKVFKSLGCKIKEISLPMSQYAIACYYLIATSETSSNLARYDSIRYGEGRNQFGDEAKRRIMLGAFTLSSGYYDAYYLKATKVRTLIKNDFAKAFNQVDAIIAPTSPTPSFKVGEKVNDPLKMYLSDIFTIPINLVGIPSLAIPSGLSKNGLPIGMQIIGKQFSEDKILNIGHQYEKAVGGFPRIKE